MNLGATRVAAVEEEHIILRLENGQQTTCTNSLGERLVGKVMRLIARGGHWSDSKDIAKVVIVEADSGEEVLVVLIAIACPHIEGPLWRRQDAAAAAGGAAANSAAAKRTQSISTGEELISWFVFNWFVRGEGQV